MRCETSQLGMRRIFYIHNEHLYDVYRDRICSISFLFKLFNLPWFDDEFSCSLVENVVDR